MADAGADTIAAIATPPGRGGIGVLRVSGPQVSVISRAILGRLPQPRVATLRPFVDAAGDTIDRGLALYFPAPRSFTGEPVLELHAHGSPAVLDMLLARILELNARLARPGEFTERAFLNDRLDLAQAEAVADLINAGTRAAAVAATRSREGVFSTQVNALAEGLLALRVYVEAAIDFPDEDVDFLTEGDVRARLADLRTRLTDLQAGASRGTILREGLRVAIVGAPNVGKSSLLNCLARRDSAIVTPVPGTTRDVLREAIDLDGLPLYIADTAGLRATTDTVESEGVRRAQAEMQRADQLLLVVDDRDAQTTPASAYLPDELPLPPTLVVRNKCDLSGRPPGACAHGVRLSATTGDGMAALVAALREAAGLGGEEAEYTARRRHLDALTRAAAAIDQGAQQLDRYAAGELLAEDLRAAHSALGTITGQVSSDDLLGEIFAGFCIGK